MDPVQLVPFIATAAEVTHKHTEELHQRYLPHDLVVSACQRAWDLRIRGGPFNKKLLVVGGMCMQAYELRNTRDVIFSPKLRIWAWGTPAMAKAATVAEIYHSSLQHGILQQAIEYGLEPKFLKDSKLRDRWLSEGRV